MEILPSGTSRIMGLESEYALHPYFSDYTTQDVMDSLPSDIKSAPHGFLTNGDRLYLDVNDIIEYAVGEVDSIDNLVTKHFAGRLIVQEVVSRLAVASEELSDKKASVYLRTMDTERHGRGDHENYFTCGPNHSPAHLAQAIVAHCATRIPLIGPGMIHTHNHTHSLEYVLDQKVWELGKSIISNNTLSPGAKPFIIQRDDEHFGLEGQFRLQLGCASANMFPYAIAMRFATTALVLRMHDQSRLPSWLALDKPFKAAKIIAGDIDGKRLVILKNGERRSALQIQHELASIALTLTDIPQEEQEWAKRWATLSSDMLDGNIDQHADKVEWLAKKLWLENKQHKLNLPLGHPKIVAKDIQWHRLGQGSIFQQLADRQMVSNMPNPARVESAKVKALGNTRSSVRAQQIKKFHNNIINIKWDRWTTSEKMIVTVEPYGKYKTRFPSEK